MTQLKCFVFPSRSLGIVKGMNKYFFRGTSHVDSLDFVDLKFIFSCIFLGRICVSVLGYIGLLLVHQIFALSWWHSDTC